MKKTRFTEAQIMGVLRQAEGGMPVPELCREHAISIHPIAGQQQLLCVSPVHHLQAHDGNDRGCDADADLRKRESRLAGCHREIARRDQAIATTRDMPLNAGDERLGVVKHRGQQVDQARRAARGKPSFRCSNRTREVSTGTERRSTAGDHDDTHRIVLRGCLQVIDHELHGSTIQPVLGISAIQRDRGDRPLDEAGDRLVAHFLPMPSSIVMTRSITSSAPPPIDISRESRK